LRLHGPLPEVLRRSTGIYILTHTLPLLEVQAPTDEDDHERGGDDVANDGVVVAGKVEAEDAIDEADGDDGGAQVEVDFAEEGWGLRTFEVGVVDDAEGELDDDAKKDGEADGLVRRVEVGFLWWKERLERAFLAMGEWKDVPCSFWC
jgi:hypothetical protein